MLPSSIQITDTGLEIFMRTHDPETFARAMNETVAATLNRGVGNMSSLKQIVTDIPEPILELVIRKLHAQRDVVAIFPLGEVMWQARESLKRRVTITSNKPRPRTSVSTGDSLRGHRSGSSYVFAAKGHLDADDRPRSFLPPCRRRGKSCAGWLANLQEVGPYDSSQFHCGERAQGT